MITKYLNVISLLFVIASSIAFNCHIDRTATFGIELAIFFAVMASNLKEK